MNHALIPPTVFHLSKPQINLYFSPKLRIMQFKGLEFVSFVHPQSPEILPTSPLRLMQLYSSSSLYSSHTSLVSDPQGSQSLPALPLSTQDLQKLCLAHLQCSQSHLPHAPILTWLTPTHPSVPKVFPRAHKLNWSHLPGLAQQLLFFMNQPKL